MGEEIQSILTILNHHPEKICTSMHSIIEEAERAKMFPELLRALQETGFISSLTNTEKAMLSFHQRYHKSRTDIYIQEIKNILTIANSNGARVVLIKGLANAITIFQSQYQRGFGDIDIIVRGCNLVSFANKLRRIGFQNYDTLGKQQFTLLERLEEHYSFHELTLHKTVNGVQVELEIKHTSSAVNVQEMERLLQDTEILTIGSCKVECLDLTGTFFHACCNAYTNAELNNQCFLRNYYEVFEIIRDHCEQINYKRLECLAKEFNKTNVIKLVLWQVNQLFCMDKYKHFFPAQLQWNTSEDKSEACFVKWDVPFRERVLEGYRYERFLSLYCERCYSSENPNCDYSQTISGQGKVTYCLYNNNTKGIHITFELSPLFLIVRISHANIRNYLRNHKIIIRFLNGQYEKKKFCDDYIIAEQDEMPLCWRNALLDTMFPDIMYTRDSETMQSKYIDNKYLTILIPRDDLPLRNKKLCFNFLTILHPDPTNKEYFVFDGSEFENINPIATPGVIEIL